MWESIGTDEGGAWGKRDGAGASEKVGREGVVLLLSKSA